MSNKAATTADHSKRIKKLREIREKLIAGEEVANRQLKTWLGEYFDHVAHEWAQEQATRLKPEDKPAVIREYEKRLKQAHFQYAKAESASEKHKSYAGKFYRKSDTAYELVLEYIQGEVGLDPTLELWLDRTTDNGPEAVGTGIDFPSMPRVKTSRSLQNNAAASVTGQVRTKRDIKIEVVDRAIQALSEEAKPVDDSEQNNKVKDMLKALKSR